MNILFIGDIIGEPGRKIVSRLLNDIIKKRSIDFVIANGENSAGGFGITPFIANELFDIGIQVITTGNHLWDKKEIINYLENERRLLRPANYPEEVPGSGKTIINMQSGVKIAVLHLMGRTFMLPIDCPFKVAKKEIEEIRKETKNIIIDFHAEATSEKTAFAWYLDGEVTAVIGTHTHVQTADERILSNGTGYITDAGMTGPLNSVIGIKKEQAISKFLTQTPRRFEMGGGESMLCGVILDINTETGKTNSIERLQLKG